MRDKELYLHEHHKHGAEKCLACGSLIRSPFGCPHCRNSKDSYQEVRKYLLSKGVKIE